ncbi:unnamed protein product [Orchesella dallaii]|uniref:Uncharacterized protein n=1 Tax=Orchesella dallaii TaxID=48710 RepID=A0ABP1SA69_9HEXA
MNNFFHSKDALSFRHKVENFSNDAHAPPSPGGEFQGQVPKPETVEVEPGPSQASLSSAQRFKLESEEIIGEFQW